MSVDRKLGQRVAAQRKLAGLTQEELAEKVGVAPETISRLERGASVPSLASIEKIAHVLNVEMPVLFQFRERETPKDRALDRLLAVVRKRPAEDVEVVADVASRMFERW
jgi:transcriptional regulator with XRE-family HTH domain